MPQKGTHEIEWSLYSQNLTKRIKDQFNEELWHQSPVIMCDTCKKNKPLDQYLESFSLGDISRRSTNSMRYKQTCNECQRKILAMLKDESSTIKEAYYRWASAMNLYIDEEVISYM